MKITRLTTYAVAPRWLFLRIDTDEGVTGWGEPALEGRVRTVAAAVEELGELLIGADPLRIEAHWQLLTKAGFYRGGPVLSYTRIRPVGTRMAAFVHYDGPLA